MHKLPIKDDHYRSPKRVMPLFSKIFPSLFFYCKFVLIVLRCSRLAQKGLYDNEDWADSSLEVLTSLEEIGVKVDVQGFENIKKVEGPVVFIGNHMSMMETLIFPAMVLPIKSLTFVVKESLLHYPVFKHIMRSREPVAVTRTNPREDLKTVMRGGVDRLKNGISVVVFPQTTRSTIFQAKDMSSIGVKLAKKADIPIIPVALKTDCWQNGKLLKDFGQINTAKTAYFAFGEPIVVEGKGVEEQERVAQFISERLANWQ